MIDLNTMDSADLKTLLNNVKAEMVTRKESAKVARAEAMKAKISAKEARAKERADKAAARKEAIYARMVKLEARLAALKAASTPVTKAQLRAKGAAVGTPR